MEQLVNYERMHDWLVEYLSKSRTVIVPMPFTTYTYIADPANVEHILKNNFANYPKVKLVARISLSLDHDYGIQSIAASLQIIFKSGCLSFRYVDLAKIKLKF